MTTSTLKDIIIRTESYETNWAIYADNFSADSPARIGQTQFENGGLLDGKKFFCTLESLGDAIMAFFDGEMPEPSAVEEWADEIIEFICEQ